MNSSWTLPVVLLVVLVAFLCVACLCLVITGVIVIPFANHQISAEINSASETPLVTPVVIRPETLQTATSPDPVSTTLEVLNQVSIPMNDLTNLAQRLAGKEITQLTQEPPPTPLLPGERRSFWVSNTDTNANFQVQATLRFITEHAYFWIQDGVDYETGDLQLLADAFEKQIYPTNRAFFGSEWTPGVDGDPHIYILYTRGMGDNIAGYFSSVDVYPPSVHEYSNWHEMFLFNADSVSFSEEFTFGVLAHEFQHMIHWYRDRNEDTWLNEGFSDLAMLLNHYEIGGHDFLYAQNPDLQMNDWPTDHNTTMPHYGASFLFMTYFLDRFGENATKDLVAETDNGLNSIDLILEKLGKKDPLTGKAIQADDVFMDWTLTNYLLDDEVSDGRFTYHNYGRVPEFSPTEKIHQCTEDVQTRDVHQYGVDYIQIRCQENTTLHFEGSVQVGVLPSDPHSGDYAFWSNKSDESDITLTRTFDFTDYNGELSLIYWTWYDVEKDFDYAYVEASTDGENWQILFTPSGTGEDPTGNNFGWAYNGLSGTSSEDVNDARWIQESVDLSQYAGQEVQLRFEYVTDAAVNGEGFMVDDIAIPQMNYFADFEVDDGGWEAAGFVRIQNVLPQTFRLALISIGTETNVEYLILNPDVSLEVPLSFGQDVDEVVLVVSGTTRFTRLPAAYRFYFTP
jgi:immune inhibitor A